MGNSNGARGIVRWWGVVFVHAHMLPEIVVSAKVLPTTGERALVCWEGRGQSISTPNNQQRSAGYSRFSLVWILLTCLLRCSPLAKHLLQPLTLHMYVRVFYKRRKVREIHHRKRYVIQHTFCTPFWEMITGAVGTLRPRLFLVKFGTGIGAANLRFPAGV